MSYGHAAKILLASGQKSPATELRIAVRELKAWADANPPLMDLYLDFEACQRDLDLYLTRTDPPHAAPDPERPASG